MLKKPKKGAVDRDDELHTKSGLHSLLMMFIGALIAVMIGVFLYLSPFFSGSQPPAVNKAVEVTPLPEEDAERTKFDFYEVLPEQKFQSVPDGLSVEPRTDSENARFHVDAVVKEDKPKPSRDEVEVVVVEEDDTYDTPAQNTANNQSSQNNNPVQISHTGTTYILQVRSYSNAEEADRRRAEVIMAGVDAQVLKRQDASGNTIYQVVSTPIANQDAALSAYNRLQESGIDALIVEQKRQ